MGLSSELITQFAKLTKTETKASSETTLHGTIVESNGSKYVQLDGSDLLTPITTTADVKDGERVNVLLKDHEAIVNGNVSSPAARTDDVKEQGNKIYELDNVVSYKITTEDLRAINAYLDNITAQIATIQDAEIVRAEIETLKAKFATVEHLSAEDMKAVTADIEKIRADFAEITDISTEDLTAIYAEIDSLKAYTGNFTYVSTEVLEAMKANINELDVKKLSAEEAKIKYANIDFANIGEAAIKRIFSDFGLIKDIVVDKGTITGELVGVTIKGDIIEGGTVKADKLVIRGEDGLYYKLNASVEGVTQEQLSTEEYQSALHGSNIIAKTITAEKISVSDLVAFGATIGGFQITKNAIYSGVKNSVNNTTRGIYQDNTGQFAIGDSDNYLKFYKDTDGTWKLAISASSMVMSSSNKNVEEVIEDVASKSIVKTEEQFYQSTSPTDLTGGSWSIAQPTWTEGTYIWRRTAVIYGNNKTEYTPSQNGVCITGNTGEQGEKGDPGAAGKGILKTEVYYYLSTSNTEQIGGTWNTTVPDWVDGQYYWQKIKTTYTDGNTAESTPVCITGAKGLTGSTGTGVNSITTEFYLSTSKTEQSGGSWVTTMPTWSSGKYLWTRNKIVYKNPTSTVYTSPVCDSSWEAINEIEIGGRNYIRFGKGDEKRGIFASFETVENGYAEHSLTSKKTHANVDLTEGFVLGCRDYEVGAKVVFSYDIMYTAWDFPEGTNCQEWWIGQRYTTQSISGGDTTGIWRGVTQHNLPSVGVNGCVLNEWYHVEKLITIPEQAAEGIGTNSNIQLYNSNADVAASVTFRLKNVKLEYGTRATDWTPAPEDMEAIVNEVETRVTKAETSISNNQNEINLRATTETVTELANKANEINRSLEDAKNLIRENSDAIATLTSRDFKVEFTSITEQISALNGDLTSYKEEIGNWMRFDADGNLVLGATRVEGQDAYELKLTKNRISFMLNDNEVAYISSNQLYITNSTVVQNFKIGGFTWEVRGNGNLGLIYR